MQYITLGRTGLKASVAGLGCGGNAQLGLGRGKSEREAVSLVHAALDVGVNYFDTSEAYVTESILGAALRGIPVEQRILCTKSRYRDMKSGALHPTSKILDNFTSSLRKLAVERVELYLIHGLLPMHYEHVLQEVVPALLREKSQGRIGNLGISEFPYYDPNHETVIRALGHPVWDLVMIGFHMLHQGASVSVFPSTLRQQLGTVVMYAVRDVFSRPGELQALIADLRARGLVSTQVSPDDPLGFLVHPGGASSVIDAAYRFARHQPGAGVILFGTSDPVHLRANVDSLLKPALPEADLQKLRSLFGHLTDAGLELPEALRGLPTKPG